MKMFKYSALALMVAMAVVVTAQSQTSAVSNSVLAQQGGPRGQQGGPEGQPGQMRGGMRMGQGPVEILRDPKVQQHLKLTQTQIDQINEAFPMRGPGGPGGPGGAGGPGGPGDLGGQQGDQRRHGGQGGAQGGGEGNIGRGGQQGQGGPGRGPGNGLERHYEDMAKIKTILNANQYARFEQLELQKANVQAVTRPEVVEKLGLTSDQLEQIHEILMAGRPQPGQGQQGGPGGHDPAQMQAKQEEIHKKIVAVLTSAQIATWHNMVGEKFEFSKPPTPPRGGRGDGF